MGRTAFCFDFDGTVTQQELLPLIARECDIYEEIQLLTKITLEGLISFESSFKLRVKLLASVGIDVVQGIASRVLVEPSLVDFIQQNRERCFIVTGNLDVWVGPAIEQLLGCAFYSSRAKYEGNQLLGIDQILNKGAAVSELKERFDQVIAIGDSMNDCPMFEKADLGIAYGGTHDPVSSLVKLSDYVVYQPNALLRVLKNHL
ncbi:MAG: HAD-IB family phosphatase [Bacteroidota bacterium]